MTIWFSSSRLLCFRAACLMVVPLVILSGCAGTGGDTAGLTMAQISFEHLQPLSVQVADVVVDIDPNSEVQGSYIIPPDQAFKSYFTRRFRPAATSGTLRAAIEQVQVVKARQAARQSAFDFFGMGGADIYEVSLQIRLEHRDTAGALVYGTSVTGKRSLTISEHASVAEREAEQVKMLESMFRDLDPHITTIVMHGMRLATLY